MFVEHGDEPPARVDARDRLGATRVLRGDPGPEPERPGVLLGEVAHHERSSRDVSELQERQVRAAFDPCGEVLEAVRVPDPEPADPGPAQSGEMAPARERGTEVVTRIGYDRAEVTKRRADGTEYKSTRSVRIARVTGEEI